MAVSNRFGLSGKLLMIFAVVQLIQINGIPACNFIQNAQKGISWNLMMVVSNILVFSALIGDDKIGIGTFLGDVLAPIFFGKPALLFLVFATVATIMCTNFMVNKVITVLMMRITMPIANALGIDQIQMACIYAVICTIAFMLPSASQSAFVLFSNTEWVRPGYVFKYGLPVIIIMTVLYIIWNLMYFFVFYYFLCYQCRVLFILQHY